MASLCPQTLNIEQPLQPLDQHMLLPNRRQRPLDHHRPLPTTVRPPPTTSRPLLDRHWTTTNHRQIAAGPPLNAAPPLTIVCCHRPIVGCQLAAFCHQHFVISIFEKIYRIPENANGNLICIPNVSKMHSWESHP